MQNIFTIFTGDDKMMNLKAVYQENLDPLDLTECTEIDLVLRNADGTLKHLLLSEDEIAIVTPADLGKFTAAITAEVSALLMVGELQSFDVTFTIADAKTTVRYQNALSVFQNQ